MRIRLNVFRDPQDLADLRVGVEHDVGVARARFQDVRRRHAIAGEVMTIEAARREITTHGRIEGTVRVVREAHRELPKDSADFALSRLDHFRNANGGSSTAEIRTEMQRTMSGHAAVFRTDELMAELEQFLRDQGNEQ